MKNNKRFWAILAVIMAFFVGGRTVLAAAVPMPILPYIPPQRVELYDLLNNAFGLTRLNITDDAKRLAAYLDLYVRVMGAANADLIDKMIDGAQSTRKYQIKADLINGVQSVMQEQITTGVQEWTTPTVVGAQETYDALMQWEKINSTLLPFARWQDFANTSNTKFGVNGWTVYAVWASYRGGWQIVLGSVSKDTKMTYYSNNSSNPNNGNGYYPNGTSITANYNSVVMNTPYALGSATTTTNWTIQSNTKIATNTYYYGYGMSYANKSLYGTAATRKATAQSSAITTALQSSDDIPITADSVITNGTIDRTKDVIITIPATIPTPAQGVSDLPQVQDDLGVLPMPLTQDIAQTVTALQAQSVATYGDAGDYALDLRNYFPFCLPFDIGNLLACFMADPEAPAFEWEFPIGYDAANHEFTMQSFTIDLSMWDTVAYWLRKGELAIFIVGLAAVTRQWFLRG